MVTPLNTIKNWFKTGLKPTQNQFWNWLDSFWHKDEKIPVGSIGGIDEEFNKKQDTLVSGENIKTINNQPILGYGNIEIQGGGGSLSPANSGNGINVDADGKINKKYVDVGAYVIMAITSSDFSSIELNQQISDDNNILNGLFGGINSFIYICNEIINGAEPIVVPPVTFSNHSNFMFSGYLSHYEQSSQAYTLLLNINNGVFNGFIMIQVIIPSDEIYLAVTSMSEPQNIINQRIAGNGIIITEEIKSSSFNRDYIPPKIGIDPSVVATNQSISTAYNSAVAYVDSQIKTFDYLQLYLFSDKISVDAPTTNGVLIPKTLTTAEQLWFTSNYAATAAGVVDKNMYTINLPFTNVSTSRITFIRCVWRIAAKVIFDKEFRLENTTSEFDFSAQVVKEYPTDINYNIGEAVTFELYGRVSSGTDEVNLLVGDVNRQAFINRAAPVATLSSTKIIRPNGDTVEDSLSNNRFIETTIQCDNIRTNRTGIRIDKFYQVPPENYYTRLNGGNLIGIADEITTPEGAYLGLAGAFASVGNKLFVGVDTFINKLPVINTIDNTVSEITMPERSIWGFAGAFAVVGNKVFVGSGVSINKLPVINTIDNTVSEITMPSTGNWGKAGSFALVGNKLFVGKEETSNKLVVINTVDNTVSEITMPGNYNWEEGGAFAVVGNRLFVGSGNVINKLAVINTIDNTVSEITMPISTSWGRAGAFAVVGNKVFVTGYSTLAVINTVDNTVSEITMPGNYAWGRDGAFAVVGNRLFVGSGISINKLAVINTIDNTVSEITMSSYGYWGKGGAFALVGNKLFVGKEQTSNKLAVINTIDNTVSEITMPISTSWGRAGAFALVSNKLFVGNDSHINKLAVINTIDNTVSEITMPISANWGYHGAFALVSNKLFVGNDSHINKLAVIY